VMWGGGHTMDFVVMGGRYYIRGFRAPFATHSSDSFTRDFLGGSLGMRTFRAGRGATAELNVGTPGSYANDALFPLFPDTVAVHPTEQTPGAAGDLATHMTDAIPAMEGFEYRFSPPDITRPTGQAAMARARAYATATGRPDWEPMGGINCANVPNCPLNLGLHDEALGGHNLVLDQNGRIVDITDPANASAKNMDAFVAQDPEFFASRGLTRTPLGWSAARGYGFAGGAGALAAVAGNPSTPATCSSAPVPGCPVR
jgi:hypothetical protein